MSRWRINETPNGLRLAPVTVRGLGAERLTWADLLYSQLSAVQVYVLSFPSRFDLPLDAVVSEALRAFGANTPASTSVNFWDPTDPEFSRALDYFDLKAPPALVFVPGLEIKGIDPHGPEQAHLYAITITDPEVLGDRAKLAIATNAMHEIVARSNPKEMTAYLRERRMVALLEAVGKVAGELRDQLLKLKPTLQLPGGLSVQFG